MARQFISGLAVGAITMLAWHALTDTRTHLLDTNVSSLDSDALPMNNKANASAAITPDTAPPLTSAVEQSVGSAQDGNGVRVDARANTLSLSKRGTSLLSVLDQIGQQSGITFHNTDALRDETVSIQLDAVPLEAGLRTLLAGYDAFIYYASASPDSVPQTVWIYTVGAGHDLAPVANVATAVAAEPSLDVDALLREADTGSDERQRVDALQRVVDEGVVPPRDWLEQVLQGDQSEAMRLTAFRTLTQSPDLKTTEIRAIADLALSDPSEDMREEAQRLLSDINTAASQVAPEQDGTSRD